MDQEERLSYLENVRDWQGLVEELEKGIASGDGPVSKAAFHLRLGRVLETKFLAGVKALKHFQDAYKLNPGLIESLEAARSIYWDLGKLNMVQKLLELELKAAPDGIDTSALLLELGDVITDLGDYEKAAATYARSLGASGGKNQEASACLEDAQVDSDTWQPHVAGLLRAAHDAAQASAKGRLFLRAARITRRFAPQETEEILGKAYAADPSSKQASTLYEGSLAEAGKLDDIEAFQKDILSAIADRKERADVALVFGTRWVARHQSLERGTKFLESAVKLDPENEGAFFFLTDAYGKKGGDWDRVLTLAEEAATQAPTHRSSGNNGDATFLLAQAGLIAWRQMGNLIRARAAFERLSAVAPEHPHLRAFEAQIGETLSHARPPHRSAPPPEDAPPPATVKTDSIPPAASVRPAKKADSVPPAKRPDSIPPVAAKAPDPAPKPPESAPKAPESAPKVQEAPPVAAAAKPAAAAPKPAAPEEPVDEAKIAELRALADKQDAA
jgi:tetratricopeptide (TPR) repeat protein